MKRIIFAIHLLSILLCLIVGCKSDIQHNSATPDPNTTFTVQGVQFTMVHVEGGTFTMGATSEQIWYSVIDEKPAHQVTLLSFSIGETEVTQALWKAVMGIDPPKVALWEEVMEMGKGPQHPVVWVSWDDCQLFIQKLNAVTGRNFRLPTETEWEYAAKARLKPDGSIEATGYKYSGTSSDLSDYAWYASNSGGKMHAVGSKSPNDFGIYDMSGNVIEWCQDIYTNYSTGSPELGKDERVLRGGYYDSDAASVKCTSRGSCRYTEAMEPFGFRLCLQ